ncbi:MULTISPECIES: extracellular solute-binding protein [unclassified Amycolatopsis]|uniref:ABC transporter substrate-binding protein n=1 Tax=unclassified Amycolatopsis TaxID=2618356 RepID=UPI002876F69D|nr:MULTISPECIES: extracellular solute-binding protein [unclassified Amycolatopsis]MDS0135723.1 extracellular solute-binding protein [Amycolatopsis sp. 505]MDS0145676.1 extracellular solute-binding protein [Amycolatopsis sp. CM201R]
MKRCAALVLAVVLLLSGCSAGSGPEPVTVLGPWTGDEQKAFRQVLDGFTQATGIPVDYQGTRAQNQVLRGDLQQGTPPDVAVLSNPAELAGYVRSGDVKPLDAVLGAEAAAAYSPQWRKLQQLGENAVYAVVVKADLKSIVWYTPKSFPGPIPSTWDELVTASQRLAAAGQRPWCLGMGAPPNSGFPGTDWLEDILLHRAGPDVYRSWTAGRLPWTDAAMVDAWRSWGTLVLAPGAVRGGSTAALLTSFADAGRAMFADPPGCALEHLGSFAIGGYTAIRRASGPPVPDRDFRFFPFPGSGGAGPSEVSADLAGMFRDTPAARRLMAYLAGAEGQRIWPSGGTTFSVHQHLAGPDVYRSEVSRRIAATLAGDGDLCFDASDLMPSAMTSAFYQAVLEYLARPDRLPFLLDKLEQVRQGIGQDQWLDLPC